jgi:hypothetical protein
LKETLVEKLQNFNCLNVFHAETNLFLCKNVPHLLIAHSSIGLVGGSNRGSVVAKVGLAPDVLLVASSAAAAEAELFPLF